VKLLFWRKPKWVDLGTSTLDIGPGNHKVTYSIKFDGMNVDKTIIVVPSISITPPNPNKGVNKK